LRYSAFLNLRRRSLARGSALVFGSLLLAYVVIDVSHLRPTPLLLLPIMLSLAGAGDTARCMRKQWDFYHAGVLLLLYADLMAITLLLFLFLLPYGLQVAPS
jgi:hypothetical protein